MGDNSINLFQFPEGPIKTIVFGRLPEKDVVSIP